MRLPRVVAALLLLTATAMANAQQAGAPSQLSGAESSATTPAIGFDRNSYPGEAALPLLRKHFAFVGYWLTNPPGASSTSRNSWLGKRAILREQGFGFLVLANGKEDAKILKATRGTGRSAEALGQRDAATAIAAAQREHFPAGTTVFLDQEEGGRLLPEQADYLFGWTEAVARSAYKPGAYVSGQAVDDGPGKKITTAQDIREQVASKHLHPIALWIYDDACPPSNGCSFHPPSLAAIGAPDVVAWQYAQSPRRTEITAACARTYTSSGNCVVPELPSVHLDLSVSRSDDPSHGR